MQYRAISADGHINEPPNLWVDNLPDKFKDRGPHVIETPEHQGPRLDHGRPVAAVGDGLQLDVLQVVEAVRPGVARRELQADQGPRRPLRGRVPRLLRPEGASKEITEDKTDAEVIFNGVGTVWNGIKLCPDKELSLACYQVYNDWIAEFQAYAPERFICNGTLPTTGIDDCIDELHRCADLGLRTVQLESYPSGSFSEPSPEDDRFWAAAVELDMPINVHTQFFFPAGDLGSKLTAEGVPERERRAKSLGIDIAAGEFTRILFKMITTGVFERFPDLKFIGTESYTGWVPYYLERFDESVKRNRRDWNLPLLPSEYFHRNVSVVYIVDEIGLAKRYDVGIKNIMWGPDFPHSTSSWPVDYELGLEILERAGATPSEIERIMWRNAADLYKLPYDEPAAITAAA